MTIGDCVLFPLLQNATNFYLIDLVKDLPNLKRFYDGFARRESAKVTGEWYPPDTTAVASHWIKEANLMSERVAVCFRIGAVYFAVGASLIARVLGWEKK